MDKSVSYKKYFINIRTDGSIHVHYPCDNAMEACRAIAVEKNFAYDEKWNTRQFAKKLCDEFGASFGYKSAYSSLYGISIENDGSVTAKYWPKNVAATLREIAKDAGFKYDENWNTRQFGSKLIDFLKEKK